MKYNLLVWSSGLRPTSDFSKLKTRKYQLIFVVNSLFDAFRCEWSLTWKARSKVHLEANSPNPHSWREYGFFYQTELNEICDTSATYETIATNFETHVHNGKPYFKISNSEVLQWNKIAAAAILINLLKAITWPLMYIFWWNLKHKYWLACPAQRFRARSAGRKQRGRRHWFQINITLNLGNSSAILLKFKTQIRYNMPNLKIWKTDVLTVNKMAAFRHVGKTHISL